MLNKYQEEGSHWYNSEGVPTYEIKGKNGKMRATTLRDAKKLNLVPSVTSIMQLTNKPALNTWVRNQYVESTVDLLLEETQKVYKERNYQCLSPEEYREVVKKEVITDSFKNKLIENANFIREDTAKKGTDIHSILEKCIRGQLLSEDELRVSDSFIDILTALKVPLTSCIAEESFACEGGYGGLIDCFSPSFNIVIDFKTKDFDKSYLDEYNGLYSFNKKKKFAYEDNAMQIAAYQELLNQSRYTKGGRIERGVNIYISRQDPTLMVAHEWSREELDRQLKKFLLLTDLWKYEKGIK